jgi:hypothetical protein
MGRTIQFLTPAEVAFYGHKKFIKGYATTKTSKSYGNHFPEP